MADLHDAAYFQRELFARGWSESYAGAMGPALAALRRDSMACAALCPVLDVLEEDLAEYDSETTAGSSAIEDTLIVLRASLKVSG